MGFGHAFHHFTHNVSHAVSHAVHQVAHEVTHPQEVIKTAVHGVQGVAHGVGDIARGHIGTGLGEIAKGAGHIIDPAHLVGAAHQLARPITNPINKALVQGIKGVTGHNVLGSHPLNAVGTVVAGLATAGAGTAAIGALEAGAGWAGALSATGTTIAANLESMAGSALSGLGTAASAVGAESLGSAATTWGGSLASASAANTAAAVSLQGGAQAVAERAGHNFLTNLGSSLENQGNGIMSETENAIGKGIEHVGQGIEYVEQKASEAKNWVGHLFSTTQTANAQTAAFTPGAGSAGGFTPDMLTRNGAAAAAKANLGEGAWVTSGLTSAGEAGMAGGSMYGGAGVMNAGVGFTPDLLTRVGAAASQEGGGFYGSALTTGGANAPFGSTGFKAMLNSATREGINQNNNGRSNQNQPAKQQKSNVPEINKMGIDDAGVDYTKFKSVLDSVEKPKFLEAKPEDLLSFGDLQIKQFTGKEQQFQTPTIDTQVQQLTAF